MTAEKTDKELVAEFMEGRIAYVSYGKKDVWVFPFREDEGGSDELLFDKSWDWLMPVVEKIHKLNDDSGNELIAKYDEVNHDVDIFRLSIAAPKSIVYKGVVEFIKWYKQQAK